MGPIRPSIPSPEEENPRLKCRNCGAFGHTARNRKCPIKHYNWNVDPQFLGPKEKENKNPCKTQNLQNPGLLGQAKREKEPRNRCVMGDSELKACSEGFSPSPHDGNSISGQEDEQRENVHHKFPRGTQRGDLQSHIDVSGSPLCFTHPSQPKMVHKNRKRSVGDHVQISLPLDKKSDRRPPDPAEPPRKGSHPIFSPLWLDRAENMAIRDIPKSVSRNDLQNPVLENVRGQRLQGHSQGPKSISKMHGLEEVLNRRPPALCPNGNWQPHQQSVLRTHGQIPKLSSWIPGKKPLDVLMQCSHNPSKKKKLSSCQTPENSTMRPALKPVLDQKTPLEINRLGLKETAKQSMKIPPLILNSGEEQPDSTTHLLSAEPCMMSTHPMSSHDPGPPIKMIFTRLRNDFWSSNFLAASSAHADENTTPSTERTAFLERPEGAGCQVPGSILVEDLQISSSSEDAD